ncbi:hypothetical protein CAC42_3144 [Sphaceloma murrayae]|uniref:Ribosome biogenesis protein YTM1 n=1 Tax=Sphaceloma murrayae TaxID=2082308 RepID=A0A2K1QRZ7_9PEZI|nr:hypothetical protein CAC42_3144 [Sphaceloma murrayae]
MATQTGTMMAQEPDRTSQVRISLSTQSPDIELPESTGPILVSTELRRIQLSTLVNRLLSTSKPIPFEFLINGTFLRSSLDDFLTENGISAETTLQIEYVRAQIPPQHVTSFQHDDWVSSLDVLSSTSPAGLLPDSDLDPSSSRLLSASYDGLLRTWSSAGSLVSTSSLAHSGPIKSARFLSPTLVASAGLDRTVRLWTYTSDTFTPLLDLYAHTASVDRLAAHPNSQKLLAASSDGTISLFSTNPSSLPPAPTSLIPPPPTKRRKTSHNPSTVPAKGPLSTLKSHTSPVSDVAFSPTDATVAYSTSHDHTLKTWDLTTSLCVDTRPTSHALLSVHPLSTLGLVAAGTSARHISLVDPRADASRVVAGTLRGHTNGVVALGGNPGSEYGLVSASHDGTVRGWDVRGSSAVSSAGVQEGKGGEAVFVLGMPEKRVVGGDGIKVFDVCWDREWGLVSGGEGKRVDVWRDVV